MIEIKKETFESNFEITCGTCGHTINYIPNDDICPHCGAKLNTQMLKNMLDRANREMEIKRNEFIRNAQKDIELHKRKTEPFQYSPAYKPLRKISVIICCIIIALLSLIVGMIFFSEITGIDIANIIKNTINNLQ